MVQTMQLSWIVKIFGAFFIFVFIPGITISIAFWPKEFNCFERIGHSFALGFLAFVLQAQLGYIAHFPISFLFGLSWINVSICFIFLICKISSYQTNFSLTGHTSPRYPLIRIFVFVLIVSISVCGFFISLGSEWYPRGDAAIHLQAIRKIISYSNVEQPQYSLLGRPVIWDHSDVLPCNSVWNCL